LAQKEAFPGRLLAFITDVYKNLVFTFFGGIRYGRENKNETKKTSAVQVPVIIL
jgi:hypothetical protein